ncbi:caprin-2 [Echeneis naucrates]|uniref:caprin-2 n=1 Tax=Echeneis naucrates TaxID=173247 RepID=UPI00111453BE|nr:caprin-2 [Echeneis naucrates]
MDWDRLGLYELNITVGRTRVDLNMVQLSPSPTMDVTPPPEYMEDDRIKQEDLGTSGSLKVCSPGELSALQLSLEVSTSYHGYETYIEDGLICLKHKVRNLEKKKLKLEDYKKRLNRGEALNKDQMVAVEKYEEVIHNLEFARELHKTLDGLTETLLRAQKKVVKKEQVAKVEVERKRLSLVLQVQHLLHSMQQEHVQRDLLDGQNQAPHIPAQQLHSLSQLATLLGIKRDNRLSLVEHMEQATLVYLDLLEGKDKPVAGSTFKLLKEELTRLLNSKYFSCLPPPPTRTPEMLPSSNTTAASKPGEPSEKQSWKGNFQGMRECEPPDSWDMEFPDDPSSPHTAVYKPWRGAATFIPKGPVSTKKQPDSKRRKERQARAEQRVKAIKMDMPIEVFNSLSALPKDPILRRQQLEDLMTNIHGSLSFMQDSLLEGETSPTHGLPGLKRRLSGSASPLGNVTVNKQSNISTFIKLLKTPGTESGKQSPHNGVGSCTSTPPQEQTFATPPTRRTLTSAPFQNIQSVFKVNTSISQNGDLNYKPDSPVFSEPRYSTASTQTPPEFAPSEDEPQPDCTMGNGGQNLFSPGQSGSMVRPSQPHYRGSVRGGPYIPQTHLRDSGPLLYAARDSGYQNSYRRGGGRHNSTGWSDSSQVSSPDREGTFTNMDSGHGDSLSVSTMEVPLTPHGHHHTALLPMQLYPLSQPLRVAFTASRTANFAPGNLDQPIVFDQLHSNLGEMYDTHIGRFTCPVNGTYVFIFHILKLAINVPLYINLMRNEDVMVSAYANDGAPDHETASNHAILPLFQGDQVWLRLHRGAIYGSTWKYSTFSGFMLYQD